METPDSYTVDANNGARIFSLDWSGTHRSIVSPPQPSYRLKLAPYFSVEQAVMPNRWWRFWQWVLLGWTWEKMP